MQIYKLILQLDSVTVDTVFKMMAMPRCRQDRVSGRASLIVVFSSLRTKVAWQKMRLETLETDRVQQAREYSSPCLSCLRPG
jgi:hypothetical protein